MKEIAEYNNTSKNVQKEQVDESKSEAELEISEWVETVEKEQIIELSESIDEAIESQRGRNEEGNLRILLNSVSVNPERPKNSDLTELLDRLMTEIYRRVSGYI